MPELGPISHHRNKYGPEKKIFTPFIGVLAGLPLSGKSTLGEAVAAQSNIVFLDVDAVRHTDKPSDVTRGSEEEEKQAMVAAYGRNHERAKELLTLDHPVLLAATYSRENYQEQLKQLADATGKPIVFFLLEASDDAIRNRLMNRPPNNLSNIRTYEDYVSVRDRYKKIADVPVVGINTTESLEQNIQEIFSTLQPYTAR